MEDKLKAIIIDDESNARVLIKSYLAQYDNIELLAECADGFDGALKIKQLNPDLVFLDIQMPKLTGFEMLELIDRPPMIVFSTAYDEFAIKAFEFGAVDYLLKPFNQARFARAIQKALSKKHENTVQSLQPMLEFVRDGQEILQRIAVKKNNSIRILMASTIQHIEAQDDYVFIFTTNGDRYIKSISLKYLEDHLDPMEFVRVHRSHLIRLDQVADIERYEKESFMVKLKGGGSVPASKSGYKRLKDILHL